MKSTQAAPHEFRYLAPLSGGKPRQMVMLLHGYGASCDDLLPLGSEWRALLPDAIFIAPNALEPCEISPAGYQWFSLGDWSPQFFEKGVRAAAPALNAMIDDFLQEFEVEDENLVLAGFSQGAMMALYCAPRRPKKIAGVIGYSGALLAGGDMMDDPEELQKPPVLLVHGSADDVVAPDNLEAAAAVLGHCGFVVEKRLCHGLGHGIDAEGLAAGARFLQRVLAGR